MISLFFALLLLVAAPVANANDTWANCRGSYSQTVNGQSYQSEFFISIQNDLSYESVEFNYLFTDVDSGYLVPITKKERLSKNKIEVQVSYANAAKPFASFEVIYRKNQIITIKKFVASDVQTGAIIGPMTLQCRD